MGRSTTSVLSESDEYQIAIDAEGEVSAVTTGSGRSHVRLTRVALHHLGLSTVEENLARVAFIQAPDDRVLISFTIGDRTSQVWGGIKAEADALITVRPGQSVHARTYGPCHWGVIWFPAYELTHYSSALTGASLALPDGVCLWRPPTRAMIRLRQLHSAAIRAAHTQWQSLTVDEAAHGLEQQLIHAVIECLVAGPISNDTTPIAQNQSLAVRFEHLLRARPEGDLGMSDITAALEVSDRSLRRCCGQQFGLSPMRYVRLHRMQSAHRILRRGIPARLRISDIAKRYGFRNAGRFATKYRALFGELPSLTLRQGQRRRLRNDAALQPTAPHQMG